MKYIFVVFVLSFLNCFAQDTISYKLNRADIESVTIYFYEDEYQLQIDLTDSGTEEFYELTKQNIGKLLKIIFNDFIIVEAIIRTGIDSGRISKNNIDEHSFCSFVKHLFP